MTTRKDKRLNNELRKVKIIPHVLRHPEGSAEISLGNTKLICSAMVDLSIPKWITTPNVGWLSAEYGMLPGSTHHRIKREKSLSGGRSQEISRLIGRSLRSAVDLKKLGERQIYIDCDVVQADGGTRTSAITGGFVALALALKALKKDFSIKQIPIKYYVSAVSVGVVNGEIKADLCYGEDKQAQTDMNVVFCSNGDLIEVQGTAEAKPFSRNELNQMLELAWSACQILFEEQKKAIGSL